MPHFCLSHPVVFRDKVDGFAPHVSAAWFAPYLVVFARTPPTATDHQSVFRSLGYLYRFSNQLVVLRPNRFRHDPHPTQDEVLVIVRFFVSFVEFRLAQFSLSVDSIASFDHKGHDHGSADVENRYDVGTI